MWSVNNPRALRKAPYREPPALADRRWRSARCPRTASTRSVSRRGAARFVRARAARHDALPRRSVSRALAAGLRGASERSRTRPTRFGRSVFGGTTLVLSDMLGNNHLAISGEINGRVQRGARAPRLHEPVAAVAVLDGALAVAVLLPLRRLARRTRRIRASRSRTSRSRRTSRGRRSRVTAYPLNRFTRIEFGAGFNNIDRSRVVRHAKGHRRNLGRRVLRRQHAPRPDAQLLRRPDRAGVGQHAVRLHRAR